MVTSIPTRSQGERADQTRARILAAAVRQFSENGLAGARTELIAEAAGVNKALLYYYFKSKDALYSAALESVFESVRADSDAVLGADTSAGERFLQIVLNNFDRSYTHPSMKSFMQQEMVRLHRGEENTMARMAEGFFKPMWVRIHEVLREGIASGELIQTDPTQIHYVSLGANVFYFLSAPLTRLAFKTDPLDREALKYRRQTAIEFLGESIFVDRKHGARVAARVLAATPMPKCNELAPNSSATINAAKDNIEAA
jgi:TetR/AcrR family transcriptional regulator